LALNRLKREQREVQRLRTLLSFARYHRGSADAFCIAFDVLFYWYENTFHPYFSKEAKRLFWVSIRCDPREHESKKTFDRNY